MAEARFEFQSTADNFALGARALGSREFAAAARSALVAAAPTTTRAMPEAAFRRREFLAAVLAQCRPRVLEAMAAFESFPADKKRIRDALRSYLSDSDRPARDLLDPLSWDLRFAIRAALDPENAALVALGLAVYLIQEQDAGMRSVGDGAGD